MGTGFYIKGFNGLRAISILFVLGTHLGLQAICPINFFKNNWYLVAGSTGVTIFFTLSGFLITSLLLNEKKRKGYIDIKNFFVRRFLRLFPPLLILLLTLSVLMKLKLISANYTALFFSFLYIYNYIPHGSRFYMAELNHTWSLAIEEQFYLLWPFFVNYTKKNRIFFLIPTSIIAISLIVYKVVTTQNSTLNLLQSFMNQGWFIPACFPIMLGSVTAISLFFFPINISIHLKNKLLFLFIAAVLYISPGFMPDSLGKLLISVSVSITLLWIYFNQNSRLVKVFELKPLSFLGKISYGLYIYQGLFLTVCPCGKLSIQQFPLNILLTIIVSVLSYFIIEKKIMIYKLKFK